MLIWLRLYIETAPRWHAQLAKNSISSGDGLMHNRQQAIAWTNDDLVHW